MVMHDSRHNRVNEDVDMCIALEVLTTYIHDPLHILFKA